MLVLPKLTIEASPWTLFDLQSTRGGFAFLQEISHLFIVDLKHTERHLVECEAKELSV